MIAATAHRASINGAELAYRDCGEGEPVILIHGGLFADAFASLVAEPALASQYRLITYHRRGYGRSSRSDVPISVAGQASDCIALMKHLGVERAHVVGYSFGG